MWVDSGIHSGTHLRVVGRRFLVSENLELPCVHSFALPPAGFHLVG